MRPHRRIAATIAGLALLAALLGACGDAGKGPSGSVDTPKEDVEAKAPTAPTADPELDEEMGELGAAARAAGCAFGTYEEEGIDHVDEEDLEWDTFPPSSGLHLGTWAPYGEYDEQVADGFAVHNLEHGGVNVWLGEGTSKELAHHVGELLDTGEKWLVAPRPDVQGLAVIAWAKGLTCTTAAIDELGEEKTAELVDEWFQLVESTGSDAEKDVPAVPGSMAEPVPTNDTSVEPN